jgi:NAD(P)-dependent dehydrogenase (short-subunit alcohol dehydrogenase family)
LIDQLENRTVAEQEFASKVALVAGGSLGIGKAAARTLAARGASVVICGRREGPVQSAVAELKNEGLDVEGLAADISVSADAERAVKFAVERYGGIDILVNSAGIQRYGTVVDTDEATWDEVFATNVKGMYLTSHFAIPEMRKRVGGAIVNVSSVQAFASQKSVAAYTASKGAINALTRAMALDHAEEKIRVVAVCPGSVDTPMLRYAADVWKGEQSSDDMVEAWGKMHPLGRVGTPEDVAELIAFLASDRASFITGGEYKVDGGLLSAIAVVLPD